MYKEAEQLQSPIYVIVDKTFGVYSLFRYRLIYSINRRGALQ